MKWWGQMPWSSFSVSSSLFKKKHKHTLYVGHNGTYLTILSIQWKLKYITQRLHTKIQYINTYSQEIVKFHSNSRYSFYLNFYFDFLAQHRHHIKKQRHYFANKGPFSQSCGFSSSHVWMWELDCEESWATKNWCFWSVVLEKTLESPLDCKEIQPVHPKGDHSLVFIRRTDAKAETLILWPPHAKSWLIGEDSDAGRDWGQEKETTEDEMAGWHHQLNGHEFEWTQGVGDGQGGLAGCHSWGCKE